QRQLPAKEAPRSSADKSTTRPFGDVKCYASNQLWHVSHYCPDKEANARNDAYLARRAQDTRTEAGKRRTSDVGELHHDSPAACTSGSER
ncbi:hypothetical protein PHMEG_00031298, partial [Phytophthora megakarya]